MCGNNLKRQTKCMRHMGHLPNTSAEKRGVSYQINKHLFDKKIFSVTFLAVNFNTIEGVSQPTQSQ
jgi:hypothetical protein